MWVQLIVSSVFQSGSWCGMWYWDRGKSSTGHPNFAALFWDAGKCCATQVSQSFTTSLGTGSSGAGGCLFLFSCSFVGLLLDFYSFPPPIWDKGAGSKCHSTWGDERGKLQQTRVKAGALFVPELLSAQSAYLIVLEKCSQQISENFEEVKFWSIFYYW